MSRNSEYWAERAEAAVLRAEKLAENAVPEMIRAFERAKRDLQNEILAFFGKYAENNRVSLAEATKALSLSELKDFRESLKAFTELAKECIGTYNLELENLSVKARVTRLEALEFECDSILQRLYQEQRKQAEGITTQAYIEGYYHRLFDIERYTGFQMPFSRVNTKAIEAVLKYPVNGADISTRLWRQDMDTGFKIRETLMNIFTTGRPPQDFAEELSKIIGAHDKDGNLTGKKYEAYRLLYNEVSYATGKAHLDAYEADGIDQYECVETLDRKTCEHCGHMDGKIFDREKAVVGETYPPFHVGCRGTTAAYIPSMREFESERAARDPVTGKTVYVKDMTYEEWRKRIDKTVSNGIIKSSDIEIGKSVGAAAHRDKVNLPQGGYGKVAEGTRITKVVTFAGKGTNKKVKVAEFLSKQYGVPASEWKKVRGDGYVETQDGIVRHAELHWFESDETGRVKMKVKRYFNDES